MISIDIVRDVREIKSEWEQIYSLGYLSPFQSFEAQLIYQTHFYNYYRRWPLRAMYVVARSEDNIMILPITVCALRRRVADYFYGSTVDYFDVLIGKKDTFLFNYVIQFLSHKFLGYQILFGRVHQNSILHELLSEEDIAIQEKCVSISIGKEYEEYYHRLSAHQRQNIRTSYNRIAKENIHVELRQFPHISHKLWHQCYRMYERRAMVHRGGHDSFFKACRIGLLIFSLRWRNLVNLMIRKTASFYILFFNDIPVAFMAGFFSNDGAVYYVPRLSANDDWAFYSPGIILVNETAKMLINSEVSVIDLTAGDEKYKYLMGGITHMRYTYSLNQSRYDIQNH